MRFIFCLSTSLFIILILSTSTGYSRVVTTISSGNWDLGSIWDIGSSPLPGDTIIITASNTIALTSQVNYSGSNLPTFVNVAGRLVFNTGIKLILPCYSIVTVQSGGTLVPGNGGGNSNYIDICGDFVWNASKGVVSGYFTLGMGPLPVGWLGMNAIKGTENTVQIKWSTASEVNNDFFTIERSADGTNFNPIGKLKGQGTTSTLTHYLFTDNDPLYPTSYYRIRQTDFNGKNTWSDPIVFKLKSSLNDGVVVYPNPSRGVVFLKDENTENNTTYLVCVYNQIGAKVFEINLNAEQFSSPIDFKSENNIPSGNYTIVVTTQNNVFTKSLIVQNQ